MPTAAPLDFAFVRAGDAMQIAVVEPAAADGSRRRLVLAGATPVPVASDAAASTRRYAFARRRLDGAYSVVGRPLIYPGDAVQLWMAPEGGFSADPTEPQRAAVEGVTDFAVADASALPAASDWARGVREALAGTDPDRPTSRPLPPGAHPPLHAGAPFTLRGTGTLGGRTAAEWVETAGGTARWAAEGGGSTPPPAARCALSPIPGSSSPDWREFQALTALLTGPLASRTAGGHLQVACLPEARAAITAASGDATGRALTDSLAAWTRRCQIGAEADFFRAQTGVPDMAAACPAQQRLDHQLCYWDDDAMAFGCKRHTERAGCADAEFAGGSPVLGAGAAADITAARMAPVLERAATSTRPSLLDAVRHFASFVAALVAR